MKLDDVLTLARAGYSANQIAQFAQLEKQALQPGAAQPGAAQEGAAQEGTAQPAAHNFNDIYQMIAGIRDDIHTGNLLNAAQAGAAEPSADDIIANIINPKNEGGNK